MINIMPKRITREEIAKQYEHMDHKRLEIEATLLSMNSYDPDTRSSDLGVLLTNLVYLIPTLPKDFVSMSDDDIRKRFKQDKERYNDYVAAYHKRISPEYIHDHMDRLRAEGLHRQK